MIPSNLEKTLIDICTNLETENENLEKNIEILKDEIKDKYDDEKHQDLIPHYRLAVIRSQNQKNYYYEKYKKEKKNSKNIKKLLDDAFFEIEKYEKKNSIHILREEKEDSHRDNSYDDLKLNYNQYLKMKNRMSYNKNENKN